MNLRSIMIGLLAGLAATSAGAVPGNPIPGIVIKGGKNPGAAAGKVVVTVDSGTSRSYVVDPVTLRVTLLDERQAKAERDPGKNDGPALGASASLIDGRGRERSLPSRADGTIPLAGLGDATYTLIVRIPPAPGKGIGSAGIRLEIPVTTSHGSANAGPIVARTAGAPLKGVGVSLGK